MKWKKIRLLPAIVAVGVAVQPALAEAEAERPPLPEALREYRPVTGEASTKPRRVTTY